MPESKGLPHTSTCRKGEGRHRETVTDRRKKRPDLNDVVTSKSAALMMLKVDCILPPTEAGRQMPQEGIESVAYTQSVPDWRKPWQS